MNRYLRNDAVNVEQGDTCRSVRNLVVSLPHACVTCGTLRLHASWNFIYGHSNSVENAVAYLGLSHLFQEASACGQEECGHFAVSEGLSSDLSHCFFILILDLREQEDRGFLARR